MSTLYDFIIDDFNSKRVIYSNHSAERMFERGIYREDIVEAIPNGEVLEIYGDDFPCPSILVLISINARDYHVVVGKRNQRSVLITIYQPDSNKWVDSRRRRK